MNMHGVTQIVLCGRGGINCNWYALVQINANETATVLWEDSFHKFDYRRGAAMDDRLLRFGRVHYDICELNTAFGEERMATGIEIGYKLYPLAEQVGRWDFPKQIDVINDWLSYWEAEAEAE